MKKNLLYIAGLSLALAGCTDWLDVNETPNNATAETVSAELLLYGVENDIAGDRAGYSVTTGSTISFYNWSQMFTKSGDYSGNYVYLNGNVVNGTFNAHWQYRYSRIAAIRSIKEKAEAANQKGLLGIAQVLECIEFRELVDLFGDVPYSEGGLGADNLTPSYDKAEDIYKELCKEIIEAENNIESGSMGSVGSSDLYFFRVNGKKVQGKNFWLPYAKSIELSLLMRISNVSLFNEVNGPARLQALENECLTDDALCNPGYYQGSGKMNPQMTLWGHSYTWGGDYDLKRTGNRSSFRSQYDATEELVKFMRDTKNPLIRVYLDPREKNQDQTAYAKPSYFYGEDYWYTGVPYGVQNPMQRAYVSLVGEGAFGDGSWNFKSGIEKDLVMYPACIVKFYLAEAALRGLIGGGDAAARAYYEDGVKLMFKQNEKALKTSIPYAGALEPIANEENAEIKAAEAYLSQTEDFGYMVNWDLLENDDKKLEAIMTQKWLGYYLIDPLEAWSEIRRTDYPSWLHASWQWSLGENKMPARILYPQTEKMLNADNFAKNEKKDIMNDLIFWDVKNPVRVKANDNLNSGFVNGYEK